VIGPPNQLADKRRLVKQPRLIHGIIGSKTYVAGVENLQVSL
jgi:hypothetical protein